MLQHILLSVGLVAELALLCGYPGAYGEVESAPSSSLVSNRDTSSVADHLAAGNVRQKRAPGWGKRGGELDNFDGDDLLEAVDEDTEAEKRAPGWGKRAPGWGKRAPGWGKRAPGWGKRAPGWGKRAPGWGKRAPGWGKRSDVPEALEEEKRAPGWGKRAPGWGKRAPGWGKRSGGVESETCQVLKVERDFYMTRALEAEAGVQKFCGSEADMESSDRK